MDLTELMKVAKDQLTVGRVFGEPVERGGVTVVPVARVMGGGGGGQGFNEGEQGEGAGFGIVARPAGMYLVRGQEVTWKPAVDADRLITAATAVIVSVVLARALRRRH